ncbi:hypothetical protein SAMN05428988_5398 [Chitinophaga sp. YR573]|uniref:hypothetical protein n=1 Tax=Chitinophaga sp. YR573 TaxID=1881040 RepID=UPI0008B456D2|nr:hypothetical protein [Chitinophaga sp. YR573]SEW42762.1 hypothetical protein SAMN05428988_5398 [Chitinophaga sp. YR573]
MRKESEIISKIEGFNTNLLIIEERINEELQKHYEKRNKALLLFLNKERCVWEFAVEQMKWMLEE